MKEDERDFLVNVAIAILVVIIIEGCCMILSRKYPKEVEVVRIVRDTVYVDRWASLVEALIQVESEGLADAVNERTGATGILQLMPIYVADANRIVREERYTLEDRYSEEKSLEMFEIVQRHYNPERDIDKAIRLHNPRGGEQYKNKVLTLMNF